MSGPRLVSLLLLLAPVVALVVLLFSLERHYRRHAAWIAHRAAMAGTEQQDRAALTAGTIPDEWTNPTRKDTAHNQRSQRRPPRLRLGRQCRRHRLHH
ncbi:hypothetical protein [Streptomyces sp. NPDC060022]|uniref:hypothetical protein n=1 Tax=Streptomyces sp. NPDC060022 TaxID=3347039 RepID=UPI0036CBCF02